MRKNRYNPVLSLFVFLITRTIIFHRWQLLVQFSDKCG
jgi:hypothetical protein